MREARQFTRRTLIEHGNMSDPDEFAESIAKVLSARFPSLQLVHAYNVFEPTEDQNRAVEAVAVVTSGDPNAFPFLEFIEYVRFDGRGRPVAPIRARSGHKPRR